MPLRWDQLPANLRARVRAAEAAEPHTRKAPQHTDAVPYRCATCGAELAWTSTADTPKAVTDHATETGHGRYGMVMDTAP